MSTYYIADFPISDELYHHGIKGQKWGVRRYQNPDGTLTAAGEKRYGSVENYKNYQDYKSAKKQYKKSKSISDYRKMTKSFSKYDESNVRESIKRGDRMRRMGIGKTNVVAAGVARQVGIIAAKKYFAVGIGGILTLAILKKGIDMSDPETAATVHKGATAIGAILSGAAAYATVKNVSMTARDYTDIENARNFRRKQ